MENVVDITFFAIVIAGMLPLIHAKRVPSPNRFVPLGIAIEAAAFFLVGIVTALLIHTSPRIDATGYIEDLKQGAPRSHSSEFTLQTGNGHSYLVRARYDGPGFTNGEKAQVRFIAYDHALVDITMLDGSFNGWHLEERGQAIAPLYLCALGIALLAAAMWEDRKVQRELNHTGPRTFTRP